MKSRIAVFAFALTLVVCNQLAAQDPKAKFEYCELTGTYKAFSSKQIITVDFGQDRSAWINPKVKDEQATKIKGFESMVDAMNYMATDGWELVQAYTYNGARGTTFVWLLKKAVQ